MEFHRPRMKALIEAGADILACETIPCLVEAKAIARLLKEFPGTYAWISFSAKDGQHISNGESAAACAEWLNGHEQVAAVGINCTLPNFVPSLIHEIRSHTDKPVVVYPNLGRNMTRSARHGTAALVQRHLDKVPANGMKRELV